VAVSCHACRGDLACRCAGCRGAAGTGKSTENNEDPYHHRQRISISGQLEDNPSARDFASLLPLTMVLEDYARTEKIAYLPRKLSTADAPQAIDPSVGDIAFYAPWGNLAIFYRDFGYSSGLIKLGTIDPSAVAALSRSGSEQATIELVRD
jgi:hypothetical protein